jgi:hypothetical protein
MHYEPFPLNFQHIAQGQQMPSYFQGLELLSYHATPASQWRICIPTNQLLVLVCWFHQVLGHCGIHRLHDLVVTRFYQLQLRATVNDLIKHCEDCQINKLSGPGYGHLPPCKATALPFKEVAVNLIGPCHINLPN